ncbi:hypothetical protein [Hydrococcus rivularis]|nr:hypothetical protein [Hydrococcus rivularis]
MNHSSVYRNPRSSMRLAGDSDEKFLLTKILHHSQQLLLSLISGTIEKVF